MTLIFRPATREDVATVVSFLEDDMLGATRECKELAPYLAAFDQMQTENGNTLFVAEKDGEVVATYQITVISGLSLKAARRAQIESLRVARAHRGMGIGEKVMEHAAAQARAAGCSMIQLTSNEARARARAFYESIGFTASHIGFKRDLTEDL